MKFTRGRRHFSKCQHAGFGVVCARCAQADKLDAAAQAGKDAVKSGGSVYPRKEVHKGMGARELKKMETYGSRHVLKGEEAKKAFLAEAARLRGSA